MQRRNRGIFLFCLLAAAVATSHATEVKPERTTTVVLSNLDVNRIVCTGGRVSDVFFSEEKGVVVSPTKHDVFVKMKMKRKIDTGELIRPMLDVDLHIVCDGEVYTLIGRLKPVPAQTIRLVNDTKRARENLRLLGALPEEKKIMKLMLAAYRNEYEQSYDVKEIKEPFAEMGNALIDRIRTIRLEGLGLLITEYLVKPTGEIRLREADFLRPEFGKHIAAVSIDSEKQPLHAGDNVRVFIMERTVE